MSSTGTWTEYQFNIFQPNGAGNAQFTLLSQGGVTDALALSVVSALNGLAWPDGTAISMQKSARTDVQYSADLTATPPVFA